MKLTPKHEVIILLVIYLAGLALWTLPINEMPFGDVDSSVHFTSGDYMSQRDKSVYMLPYYLEYAIGGGTEGKFAYPPQFNVNVGISQIIGGARILSPYILIALLCSLGILGIYLIARITYGVPAAICAASLMALSRRDILYYLFGLWPQTIAFAFIPIVIYSFYRFAFSDNEKSRRLYLVLSIILIALQYSFHQQAFFFSIAFVVIYSVVIFLAERRLPFKARYFGMLLAGAFVLIILVAPFQFGFTFKNILFSRDSAQAAGEIGFKPENIGRLFYWFKAEPEYYNSLPQYYFSYKYVYGGYWTLPLLILGIVFIFLRKKRQDILLISWLITLYLFIHMEIVGGGRNFRFLQIEAQIFSIIMAFGLLSIVSFFRIPDEKKNYLKYGLTAVFALMAIIFNAVPIYSQLSSSYQGYLRITPPEYKATEWIMDNTEENANFLLIGTVPYNKKKWMQGLSYRRFDYDNNLITKYYDGIAEPDYIFIDYSDLSAIGRNDIIQQLQQWESERLKNSTLVYNAENVRVYKRGNEAWKWE